MICQTPTPPAVVQGDDIRPQLDAALAHLTALVTTIEADCVTAGVPVELSRHRAAPCAAMAALGSRINAFLPRPAGARQREGRGETPFRQ
jgi:hypothetical protein